MEMTPELLQKVNLLKALPAGELMERELKFVLDMVGWKNLSMAQIGYIERLFEEKIKRKERDGDKRKLVINDRVSAYKVSTGWQIYVDDKAVGVVMTKGDMTTVAQWLGKCMDMLAYVLKQPRPVMDQAQKKEEEHGKDQDQRDHEGGGTQGRDEQDDIERLHGL